MTHPAGVDITALENRLTHLAQVGSSGRGNSFYAGAAECGRRQRLLEQKRQAFEGVGGLLPMERNKFLVGSVYHGLMQMYHSDELDEADEQQALAASFRANENLCDGWRLFDGWRRAWPQEFWGQTLAIEEQIPGDQAASEAIAQHLGMFEYTARVDMVVRISQCDLPRIQTRLPELHRAGVYLLDWKTRDSHGGHDGYLNGLQALTYPLLYNLQHPEEPCQGIIWDIIIKHSRRKVQKPVCREDFEACFASTVLSHRDLHDVAAQIRGMVEQGDRNYRMDIPNRAVCSSYTGEQCQFRKSGACEAKWVG